MKQLSHFLQQRRRPLIWTGGLLTLYTLLGFLFLPWFAERQLVGLLQQRLAVTARVESLRFNPFTFTVTVEQLHLQAADGSPLFSLERFYLDLEPSYLLLLRVRVAEVTIETPQLYVNRYSATDDTFSRLARQWADTAEPDTGPAVAEPESEGELFPLEIGSFLYRNGSIHYHDAVPQTAFATALSPIDIEINNLSTREVAEKGIKDLVIHLEQNATLTWSGDFTVAPLQLSGHLALADFSLTTPYRYFQDSLPFTLSEGTLSAELDYHVSSNEAGPRLALSNLGVRIADLNAVETATGAVFLSGGMLALEGGSLVYPDSLAQAEALRIEGLNLALERNPQGVLNWLALLAAMPASDPGTAAAPPAQEPGSPFELHIGEIALDGITLEVTDQLPQTPAGFTLLAEASLQNFTLAPTAILPFSATLQSGSGGSIHTQGDLQLFPVVDVDATLAVTELSLLPLQAYLDEFALIDIGSGELALDARLHTGDDEALSYQGNLTLANLLLNDRQRGETLLELTALRVDNVDFSLGNRHLDISELIVDGLYSRVLIDENGATNIGQALIAAPDDTPAEPTSAESDAFAVSLGRLRLNDASSDFTDHNLPIVFDTQMRALNGEISGFSTLSNQAMTLGLEGQVGAFGLVEIAGELHPLDLTRQTRIELNFNNLELPTMTPYVVKFAGREIAEGRADVVLAYDIANSELRAGNAVVIRDMRLGGRVDYPDAINLPLDLAVALLKNSEGVIDLNVPVTGNMDDPQFNFGPVIRQAIINVLTNVVTAPFRLLGSLIGGDADEIDNIRFRPGRSDLAPPEQEKLQKLLAALAQRPQLELEIPAPYADREDRLALQRSAVDARIETQLDADAATTPLSQRRQAILENLYTAAALSPTLEELQLQFTTADDAEPATTPVFDALAYSADLRERLIAAETVTLDQLQALARERQATVTAFMRDGGEIAAERLRHQALGAAELDDGWLSAKFDLGVTD